MNAAPGQHGETVGEWIGAARPTPPERLAARIAERLSVAVARPARETPDVCVDAAALLLDELLSRESAGRESALDLLTVDALATYAFEAASGDLMRLRARALDAMSRFAASASAP